LREVYHDAIERIFEIDNPAPYFSAPGCRLQIRDRTHLTASCAAPSTLVRLELAMPGWRARISGAPAGVTTVNEIFQAVALPSGDSVVSFAFLPPFMPYAYVGCIAGLAILAAGLWPRRLKRSQAAALPTAMWRMSAKMPGLGPIASVFSALRRPVNSDRGTGTASPWPPRPEPVTAHASMTRLTFDADYYRSAYQDIKGFDAAAAEAHCCSSRSALQHLWTRRGAPRCRWRAPRRIRAVASQGRPDPGNRSLRRTDCTGEQCALRRCAVARGPAGARHMRLASTRTAFRISTTC
jgi:hypothetical protein